MTQVLHFDGPDAAAAAAAAGVDACARLEAGDVLWFDGLGFMPRTDERIALDPTLGDPRRKNISLGDDGVLHGASDAAGPASRAAAEALTRRYRAFALDLVRALCPAYVGQFDAAPTSLRVARVESRGLSWRKDDSRLHVDAFPSRPLGGARILRVFCNLSPSGEPRVWRVGEPFEATARRFVPKLAPPWPGSSTVLRALRVTKSARAPYDHFMLGLHDAMKADADYQSAPDHRIVRFPTGAVWLCYSDQVAHAALSGQFMMEQTLYLPPSAMRHPERSPVAVLQQLRGRPMLRAPAVAVRARPAGTG